MLPSIYITVLLSTVLYQGDVEAEPIYNSKIFHDQRSSYVVAIAVKNGNGKVGNPICTGTLISANHILTAKWCTKISMGETLVATLRESIGAKVQKRTIAVSEAKSYHEWVREKYNEIRTQDDSDNIAILTLSESPDRNVQAKISNPDNSIEVGSKYKFIGWGYDRYFIFPPQPLETTLTVLSVEDCQERTRKILHKKVKFTWGDRIVCTAGEPTVILVKGDYGGPVVDSEGKVVGIFTRRAAMLDDCYNCPVQPNLVLLLKDFKEFIEDVAGIHI